MWRLWAVKNASLGRMISQLTERACAFPAVCDHSRAYRAFGARRLSERISAALAEVGREDVAELAR